MKTKAVASLVLVVGLLAVCAPLFAHHGNVAYDEEHIVVLKGATVTRFIWANPHNLVLFDMKDAKGNVTHWSVEAGSPSALSNVGWTRDSLHPGDVVAVYLHQSKLGSPAGRLNKIVCADGTELRDSTYGQDPASAK